MYWLYIYYSKLAKDRHHINPIQKKFDNMYLIIDSSDINSVSAFNCRMNEKQFEPKKIEFLLKKKIDQKSQFSEIFTKLDCNPEIHKFTEKETKNVKNFFLKPRLR